MASRCILLRPGLLAYQDAWRLQQRIAERVRAGSDEALILLEHPPTYTLGARGNEAHLLMSEAALATRGAEVHRTDRGGDVTFHGPGQLVGYPILDLRRRGQGPSWYVRTLESAMIDALARLGIDGERSPRNHGVWFGDAKIAAIGVRVSRGITTHGLALNVNTNLECFKHIVPCGLADAGVTSMQNILGRPVDLRRVESAICDAFADHFQVVLEDEAPPASGASSPVAVTGVLA